MTALQFFADRNLGDHVVPEALRLRGWQVVTLRERYGSADAQRLADVDWIRDAAEAGEVLLTADKAVAKRPLEAQAVIGASARVFALGTSKLTGPQQAERYLENESAIFKRARRSGGPWVISVTGHGLVPIKLFG
ncbi:hypothetical protein [Agrococcus sp. SCSIO52902]|uniref:PIN-like domain-containing protein n=1 Tax=Agrococcus sp. SCSIO52902 TaxID=2933290 RepID=UPI001FF0F514|nr:hypothetical protein [Agrococcus sp. SCSIO52902]UOW01606.1 hypothetical protein MU522_04130 [Agrococcus sp. SCSIO52902]